ncbi:hypothetical protein [Coraliomargarita parva]|uniref:hypothetical protein n=1 Tax=Coraliomargarita parva TaxID=3014050 RepID=UPI0022B3F656|nr:hypothetical protein [Coraliomargarita parva]
MAIEAPERIQTLICELQLDLLQRFLEARSRMHPEMLSSVSDETAADTIYAIDRICETAILEWFEANWPEEYPVELVMEGLESHGCVTFPKSCPVTETVLKCIIDPVDGTRGIMFDKRSAWILTAVAPQKGPDTRLADIEVAAMTELPTTRAWRADQVSARRGQGLSAQAYDLRSEMRASPVKLHPSKATEVRHAFGTVSRFFPAGSEALSAFEESLWKALYGTSSSPSPLIFNDQYISSGGQFYEILAGHDRFVADLRPLAFRKLGIESNLCCHPYDIATALILEEAGCVVEHPLGGVLDSPLDTTTPVAWVAFANPELAAAMRPVFRKLVREHFQS